MATFEQLKFQVKLLPDYALRAEIGDFLLGLAVNDAQRRLQEDINAHWEENTSSTLTTVAGVRDYALPSDYKEMQSVFLRKVGATDKARLNKRSKEWFDNTYSDPATTGTPSDWMIWGVNLRIGPTPDTSGQTLLLDYSAYLATLVDGTPNNSNAMTTQYAEALRWLAAQTLGPYAPVAVERVAVFAGLYADALRRARKRTISETMGATAVVSKAPG